MRKAGQLAGMLLASGTRLGLSLNGSFAIAPEADVPATLRVGAEEVVSIELELPKCLPQLSE